MRWACTGPATVLLSRAAKGSRNHVGFHASNDILQYERTTKADLFQQQGDEPLVYVPGQYDPAILTHGNLSFLDGVEE